MPVSGRPANSALLKITHGSSGVTTKSFHRNARAAGASGGAGLAVRRLLARFNNSITVAAANNAEIPERIMTAVSHALWRRVGSWAPAAVLSRSWAGASGSAVETRLRG